MRSRLWPSEAQVRRKHEEERSELSLRLTAAEAKVQQMQALQAELLAARQECAWLKVCPVCHFRCIICSVDTRQLRLVNRAVYDHGPQGCYGGETWRGGLCACASRG